MPTSLVNLDALIPREDFEVIEEKAEWQPTATLQVALSLEYTSSLPWAKSAFRP